MSDELQEWHDAYYFKHGPCCAGCDWWRSLNSRVGECLRGRIVSGVERTDVLGIERSSMRMRAGHPFTFMDHHCGEFKDAFDWSSLPLPYRERIGALSP